jgi:hypothetical protein
MAVICQLCEKVFKKLISSTHLKFSHQMSSEQYKQQFGKDSLACPDYKKQLSLERSGTNNGMFGKRHTASTRQKISETRVGNEPVNKGKKVSDPAHLDKIRQGVERRSQRWQEKGYHPRQGAVLRPETKQRISQGVKNYATKNPEIMKERAAKAKQTLRENGYDFGKIMRGKTHSHQTIEKIKSSLQGFRIQQHMVTNAKMLDAVEKANLVCERIEGNNVFVKCNECSNQFSITRQYFSESKWREDICPICRPQPVKSQAEIELLTWIRSVVPTETVLSGNRSKIFPFELDMYLPERNLALEYCGLYWHSELQGKLKDYHKNKKDLCEAQGITLITIFEDEWLLLTDIVKSRIKNLLGRCNVKIAARKCIVKEIGAKTARDFCNENHIQGSGAGKIRLGLYYEDALIQVATFSQPNISKGSRNSDKWVWELSRLCSLNYYQITGGAGKLFKYFVSHYSPKSVISYCDLRWNKGNVYQQLGYKLVSSGTPNYWYFKLPSLKRVHRFSLRKNSQDNPQLTEWENRKSQGWNRIWDCGSSKWVWTNEKPEQ